MFVKPDILSHQYTSLFGQVYITGQYQSACLCPEEIRPVILELEVTMCKIDLEEVTSLAQFFSSMMMRKR